METRPMEGSQATAVATLGNFHWGGFGQMQRGLTKCHQSSVLMVNCYVCFLNVCWYQYWGLIIDRGKTPWCCHWAMELPNNNNSNIFTLNPWLLRLTLIFSGLTGLLLSRHSWLFQYFKIPLKESKDSHFETWDQTEWNGAPRTHSKQQLPIIFPTIKEQDWWVKCKESHGSHSLKKIRVQTQKVSHFLFLGS